MLAFTILALVISRILSSISTDKPWYSILEPDSPNYIPQLYCGTVARGRINIADQRTDIAIDPVGFAEGVEEIIRRTSQFESQPFLNEDELSWLRKETWSLLQKSVSRKLPAIKQSLLRMLISLLISVKSNKLQTVTLASLLDDADYHRIISDPDVKSKTLQFLNMLPESSDAICGNLKHSLEIFADYPYLIPDFNTKDDIKSAIKRSFQFFPYEMTPYPWLLCIRSVFRVQKTGFVYSLTRFLTAMEMLCGKYRNFYHLSRQRNSTSHMRVTLAIILNALYKKGEFLNRKSAHLFNSLKMNDLDFISFDNFFKKNPYNCFRHDVSPLASLAEHLHNRSRDHQDENKKLIASINEDSKIKVLCPGFEQLVNLIKRDIEKNGQKI
jgi:hypothetical protein